MKEKEKNAYYKEYAQYLEKCGLSGKTLVHYPDAVDNYIPAYIRKYINQKFDCFYKLKTVEIKEIYHQLLESEYWEKEIKYKTWKVRLKALEYYISYRENQ